mmetsp:Transcript_23904/g.75299  ORF Transcript_23904/g.75299 Transcript_23904/m.75299 type:complete len:293 (-) Transcript_23904:405-1283(-)
MGARRERLPRRRRRAGGPRVARRHPARHRGHRRGPPLPEEGRRRAHAARELPGAPTGGPRLPQPRNAPGHAEAHRGAVDRPQRHEHGLRAQVPRCVHRGVAEASSGGGRDLESRPHRLGALLLRPRRSLRRAAEAPVLDEAPGHGRPQRDAARLHGARAARRRRSPRRRRPRLLRRRRGRPDAVPQEHRDAPAARARVGGGGQLPPPLRPRVDGGVRGALPRRPQLRGRRGVLPPRRRRPERRRGVLPRVHRREALVGARLRHRLLHARHRQQRGPAGLRHPRPDGSGPGWV